MLIFYEDHINHTSIKDNGQGMVRRLGSEEEGGGGDKEGGSSEEAESARVLYANSRQPA